MHLHHNKIQKSPVKPFKVGDYQIKIFNIKNKWQRTEFRFLVCMISTWGQKTMTVYATVYDLPWTD
jgi:hypothetical protein